MCGEDRETVMKTTQPQEDDILTIIKNGKSGENAKGRDQEASFHRVKFSVKPPV